MDNLTNLKNLTLEELKEKAIEIRHFLIQSISKTGGHIGPNLGMIELTLALHYVFDMNCDKLLFDVGHQGYTHKILTGRQELFKTLNSINGMSRFISPRESQYDVLDASHGGTAISIGTGLAFSNKYDKKNSTIISIVGDGAFVEGMSFEGLNFAAQEPLPLIILINDNGMSIPKNVGAVNNILASKESAEKFFTSMGFTYLFISDGHNLEENITAFATAKKSLQEKTIIIHAKTIKGKGLEIAKNHPYKLHFSMPFNPTNAQSTSPVPAGKSYTAIIAKTLQNIINNDKNVYAITPSTPYASGLDTLIQEFPHNVIDVGMAEQQAAGMAAGLAMNQKKVFLCYQATFMQRAMDQIFHDICFMNLPVTIIASRSGFAGFDSPTHHAIYDISYLRGLPNLDIFYAGTSKDLEAIIQKRHTSASSPMIILHPYEAIRTDEEVHITNDSLDDNEFICKGKDGYIFTVANRLDTAIKLKKELQTRSKDVGIVNVRWIKPFKTTKLLPLISDTNFIITLEENVKSAGFGSIISELITDHDIDTKLIRIAIENEYTSTGDKEYLSSIEKIDNEAILNTLRKRNIIS
ncbi:1-deoxy-D-xylulose-5-phosphate synthase [Sulfurimonas sp. SAG-AH-194-C20]|nr:1-deoxy-D-xylulose-5-phosphate synthase [Sulfurimonas sp. SAG-AH-194-C20]MDF1878204.1 1-deoxy-D-xylulose-5-phosphate synthase [Sulfurimonas sp. SAG-AH-194-C20]